MKIRIIKRPVVEKKHGIEVGNEYEADFDAASVQITGATGEQVTLYPYEWEEIE